jgi:hypothetical protein
MIPFKKLLLASSIALALAACGGSDHDDDDDNGTPPVVTAGDVFALTASNNLISFNRDTPTAIRTTVAVSGLTAGENLVGIDYRPADGLLYGFTSLARVVTIDTATGAATVKSTLVADTTDTTAPYAALSGTEFGVDFNPVADRLRVTSNTGLNLRINVDTGATTTDGAINGGAANAAVTGSAYTNSFAGTASTALYVIDSVNDLLYLQNPPNNGTLSTPVSLGVDASAINSFDIDARNNTGYAVFTVAGARNLYRLNLGATANAATLVGALGVSEDIRGIALRTPAAPTIYAVTDDNRLTSFRTLTPNTLLGTVSITGLGSAETVLGIDFRPKDDLLYGVTSIGRIVIIDVATGQATVKATLSADATDATQPYGNLAGNSFAVDFNPVADRLRVISDLGQNLRINVDTGATTTDGAINRIVGPSTVAAAAYTNSFAGATTTSLYDIDSIGDTLALQNPPNDGTLVDVGPLAFDVAGVNGFDIAGGANGLVLAALRQSGGSSLYRVDLATAALTPVNGTANAALSRIGNGAMGVREIAISLK